jgi:hypothetical protein
MFSRAGILLAVNCLILPIQAFASDDAGEKRLWFLASRLEAPVVEIDKGDVALLFLLDSVSASASSSGFENDPSRKVGIVIDIDAAKRGMKEFDPAVMQIRFQQKLVGTSLAAVLKMICEQTDSGFVVRKDFIEILPVEALRKELKYPQGTVHDFCSLVIYKCEKTPVEKALNDIARRHDRTVVLSPLAEKALSQPISARLINVPFDVAVETLADMADLKLVRKSNVLLVTTKEQATALNSEKREAEKNKPKMEKLETPPKEKKN